MKVQELGRCGSEDSYRGVLGCDTV